MPTPEPAPPQGLIPPKVAPDSAPWWDGLNHGELRVQRCARCGALFAPASPTCQECGARGATWERLSGHGRVYSCVTVCRAMDPMFDDDVPYSVVAMDLDEGPRVIGRLLEGAGAAGMPVVADIYRIDDQPLLGFRPAERKGG